MMIMKKIYAEMIMRGGIVYNSDHGELLYTMMMMMKRGNCSCICICICNKGVFDDFVFDH